MTLELLRFFSNKNESVGIITINNEFQCFTLEDEYREEKVMHKTRIPAGNYQIRFRQEGRIHAKYIKRFGTLHRGVLHLQDVPNFTTIYIHCGNTDDHTSGCVLVGTHIYSHNDKLRLVDSTNAYINIYKQIVDAAEKGEVIYINIIDNDLFYINKGFKNFGS